METPQFNKKKEKKNPNSPVLQNNQCVTNKGQRKGT